MAKKKVETAAAAESDARAEIPLLPETWKIDESIVFNPGEAYEAQYAGRYYTLAAEGFTPVPATVADELARIGHARGVRVVARQTDVPPAEEVERLVEEAHQTHERFLARGAGA